MKPLLVLTLVFWAGSAVAQQAAGPHPADPAVRVPAVKYESPFAGYSPYREEKPAPWREVNDEVAKVRGHAGIFGGGGHAGHGGGGKAAPSKPATGTPSGAHKGH